MLLLCKEHGLNVWYDHDLKVGNAIGFNTEIEQAIDKARVVLACWSEKASSSFFVKAESLRGLELDKLCPVFIETTKLPIPFNGVHTEDLSSWDGDVSNSNWKNVLEHIDGKVRIAQYNSSVSKPYVETMERLTTLIAESEIGEKGPREVLREFHENRWEITKLLYAVDALIPRIPEESEPYWRSVFNSGHFVPDEIVGHHAFQSLKEVQLLGEKINRVAGDSLSVFENANEL